MLRKNEIMLNFLKETGGTFLGGRKIAFKLRVFLNLRREDPYILSKTSMSPAEQESLFMEAFKKEFYNVSQ